MAKKLFLFLWILSGLFLARGTWTTAQENSGSRIFVNVVLVQLKRPGDTALAGLKALRFSVQGEGAVLAGDCQRDLGLHVEMRGGGRPLAPGHDPLAQLVVADAVLHQVTGDRRA